MESVAAEDAKDLKALGLDKPARTVTLGLADGGDEDARDRQAAPGRRSTTPAPAGSPLVAVIPGALVDDLAKGMEELRAKRLLEVATYEVEGFDVAGGRDASATYARARPRTRTALDKAQWKRTAPDAKDLETNKVEDALFKLGGVEVAGVRRPAEGGRRPTASTPPAFKLAFRAWAAQGRGVRRARQKDGAVYARRPGDTAVLKLDAAKADELIKAFKEL